MFLSVSVAAWPFAGARTRPQKASMAAKASFVGERQGWLAGLSKLLAVSGEEAEERKPAEGRARGQEPACMSTFSAGCQGHQGRAGRHSY